MCRCHGVNAGVRNRLKRNESSSLPINISLLKELDYLLAFPTINIWLLTELENHGQSQLKVAGSCLTLE